MTAIANDITISPVHTEDRKNLGMCAGDTVRVSQKIQEKGKTRLQAFEGLVLSVKHGGEPGATFTVRRTASGVGVEKIFPLYSPMIDKIEIVRKNRVRRSKLYFIREKVSREIKRQMRNMRLVSISTEDGEEAQAEKKAQETPTEEPAPTTDAVEEKKEDATPEPEVASEEKKDA